MRALPVLAAALVTGAAAAAPAIQPAGEKQEKAPEGNRLVDEKVDDDALDAFAHRLVALREKVEARARAVREAEDAAREERLALYARKGELEQELSRARVREAALAARRGELAAEAEGKQEAVESWRAPLVETLDALAALVDETPPFRVEARKRAVDEVRAVAADLEPAALARRVLSLLSDEHRLGADLQLSRQPIELDGETALADVARVGQVALYFRAGERFGLARKGPAGWRFEVLPEAEAEPLRELFASLDRHVTTGFFRLPGVEVPR